MTRLLPVTKKNSGTARRIRRTNTDKTAQCDRQTSLVDEGKSLNGSCRIFSAASVYTRVERSEIRGKRAAPGSKSSPVVAS